MCERVLNILLIILGILLIVLSCLSCSAPEKTYWDASDKSHLCDEAYWFAQRWDKSYVQCRVAQVIVLESPQAVADLTGMPTHDAQGNLVVARALLHHRIVVLCRYCLDDYFHEAYHVIFQSHDDYRANQFMAYCLKFHKWKVDKDSSVAYNE